MKVTCNTFSLWFLTLLTAYMYTYLSLKINLKGLCPAFFKELHVPRSVFGPANTDRNFSSLVASLSGTTSLVYLMGVDLGGLHPLFKRTPTPGPAPWDEVAEGTAVTWSTIQNTVMSIGSINEFFLKQGTTGFGFVHPIYLFTLVSLPRVCLA